MICHKMSMPVRAGSHLPARSGESRQTLKEKGLQMGLKRGNFRLGPDHRRHTVDQ
jgi:hypothetical protein